MHLMTRTAWRRAAGLGAAPRQKRERPSLALLPGLLGGGGLLFPEKASLFKAHRCISLAIRQPLPEDVDVEHTLLGCA